MFFIAKSNLPKAAAAIRGLHGKETIRDGGGTHFAWVDYNFYLLTDPRELLNAWGWDMQQDEEGNVYYLSFLRNRVSEPDDTLFFNAIAPFVRAGSYIQMHRKADNHVWRWMFDGKTAEATDDFINDISDDERIEAEALDALTSGFFLSDEVPDKQLDVMFDSLLNAIDPEAMQRVLRCAFPTGLGETINDQRSKIDAPPITHLTLNENYGVSLTFHTSRESALQYLVEHYHDEMLDLGIADEDEDQQDRDSIVRGCFFAAYDAKNWEEAWKVVQGRITTAQDTAIIDLAQVADRQGMHWDRRLH